MIIINKVKSSTDKKDKKHLENALQNSLPDLMTVTYDPTPSILIKFANDTLNAQENPIVTRPKKGGEIIESPTTKPSMEKDEKYENVITYIEKGALAYRLGDYSSAINYFVWLLETDWLKKSSFFYLVKTLIMLDIKKEILLHQSKIKSNKITLKKSPD